jgi:uncharacterized protein YeaO (DUF488 family)
MKPLRIKRIYEPADPGEDGRRVLVDRIWPRGVSKERAALDTWLPEVGPSTELRRWFGHEPDRWTEFVSRYRAELETSPHFAELRDIVDANPTTLLYGARDTERNQAVVLAMVLRGE